MSAAMVLPSFSSLPPAVTTMIAIACLEEEDEVDELLELSELLWYRCLFRGFE